jgi:hypothetical protein
MKNLQTAFAALCLCTALIFTSCSPDYDQVSTTQEVLTRNAWQISHFSRSSQNLTSEYTNNTLFFSGNGTLVCRNGADQCTGTWSYSGTTMGETIIIQLNSNDSKMQQLNHAWQLRSRNLSAILLEQTDPSVNSELGIRVTQ